MDEAGAVGNQIFTVFIAKPKNQSDNYVKEFPIPVVAYQQQTAIIKIVNQILEAKAADLDADTADLEKEIDERVYALYNLAEKEIAIVEKAIQ